MRKTDKNIDQASGANSALNAVDKDMVHKRKSENVFVANLRRSSLESEGNVFYSEMKCDCGHPYYFEHPNDHIPGMMVLEAARQSILACSHEYGRVPLEGFHFILSEILVKFLNYLELETPVSFKLVQKECFTFETGIWSDVVFDVFIYQQNELKAQMTFQNSIASNRSYKRLRNKKFPNKPCET